MKNAQIMAVVLLIIGLGVGFFAGMQYERSAKQKDQRPQGQSSVGGLGQGRRFGGNGQNGNRGAVIGEILSADDKSITVKLSDGSSKIVLVSNTTQINKAAQASKSDLKTGERVAVFGTSNSDGSITAQDIQLNPQMRGFMGSPSASPK